MKHTKDQWLVAAIVVVAIASGLYYVATSRKQLTLRLPTTPVAAATLGLMGKDTVLVPTIFTSVEIPTHDGGWSKYPADYVAVWVDANGDACNFVVALPRGTKEEVAAQCLSVCNDLAPDPQQVQ